VGYPRTHTNEHERPEGLTGGHGGDEGPRSISALPRCVPVPFVKPALAVGVVRRAGPSTGLGTGGGVRQGGVLVEFVRAVGTLRGGARLRGLAIANLVKIIPAPQAGNLCIYGHLQQNPSLHQMLIDGLKNITVILCAKNHVLRILTNPNRRVRE